MVKILATLVALMVGSTPAFAQLRWCWRFAASGVSAAGAITTGKDADAEGFYRIVGITGTVDSATVIAMQPAGTAIPGNTGFPVDNLIRSSAPQLTERGFGFAASDGAYHNPFYLERYRDYIARPPYANGKGVEPTIEFRAVAAASGSDCPTK